MFAALGDGGAVAAVDVARRVGGTAYVAVDGQRDPAFTTLVIGDDRDAVSQVGEVGLYEVTVRPMRHQRRFWPPPAPGRHRGVRDGPPPGADPRAGRRALAGHMRRWRCATTRGCGTTTR